MASNGRPGPPILLTTPLTGWFTCAGERATGIAVLLHLVERLAERSLLVVATGGHELHWFGAQRWVDARTEPLGAAVHVGASVAVEEDVPGGGRRLASTRLAMTTLAEAAGSPVAQALEPARLNLHPSTTSWIGEGRSWSQLGVPLLSFSGAGVDFHTPGDTPDRATSPAALVAAATGIGDAVEAFLEVLP